MSDRPVPDNLWEMTMGNMPKPEGVTFDQMNAMYRVIQKMEFKEYAAEQLKFYENLWRKTKPRYELLARIKDDGDEFARDFEAVSESMRLIKEGILMCREWLTE